MSEALDLLMDSSNHAVKRRAGQQLQTTRAESAHWSSLHNPVLTFQRSRHTLVVSQAYPEQRRQSNKNPLFVACCANQTTYLEPHPNHLDQDS